MKCDTDTISDRALRSFKAHRHVRTKGEDWLLRINWLLVGVLLGIWFAKAVL
jgi:hypothetical protein